jgi:hypothetical protein
MIMSVLFQREGECDCNPKIVMVKRETRNRIVILLVILYRRAIVQYIPYQLQALEFFHHTERKSSLGNDHRLEMLTIQCSAKLFSIDPTSAAIKGRYSVYRLMLVSF